MADFEIPKGEKPEPTTDNTANSELSAWTAGKQRIFFLLEHLNDIKAEFERKKTEYTELVAVHRDNENWKNDAVKKLTSVEVLKSQKKNCKVLYALLTVFVSLGGTITGAYPKADSPVMYGFGWALIIIGTILGFSYYVFDKNPE